MPNLRGTPKTDPAPGAAVHQGGRSLVWRQHTGFQDSVKLDHLLALFSPRLRALTPVHVGLHSLARPRPLESGSEGRSNRIRMRNPSPDIHQEALLKIG